MRAHKQRVWVELFLCFVYEMQDKKVLSVVASWDKIEPDHHKGCVLDFETADLIFEPEDIVTLLVPTQRFIEKT